MKLTVAVIGKDKRLITKLNDQKTDNNEVIAATTEQKAIDKAKGEYISFVYAGDDIGERYTKAIMEKLKECEFDMCFIGWRYLNWHDFKYIGFAGGFKPMFCAVLKKEFFNSIKEKTIKSFYEKAKIKENLGEIIYSHRGEKG